MTTTATQPRDNTSPVAGQPDAANGLALVRMTIGAMLVRVFFENLGKGAYTPAGYAGVINYTSRRATHRRHGSGLWD